MASARVSEDRAYLESKAVSGSVWRETLSREADPDRALPTPTRDPEALKADLDSHGYCLIEEALDAPLLSAVRKRVLDQLDGEIRSGVAPNSSRGHRTTTNLLNKGSAFFDLVQHEQAVELLTYVLGPGYLISTMDAPQSTPGTLAQGLHIDQFTFGFPTDFPLVANACWMLDEFTEENGATRVIPGSHLWSADAIAEVYDGLGISKNNGDNPAGTIPVEGPAGTCMVFDGRLLHGAGKNTSTDRARTSIFSLHCRGWIRQFENPFLSLSSEVLQKLPDLVRARIGYEPWGLCGGYQVAGIAPPAGIAFPNDQIGEL